jgi:hypothetical protein
VALVVHQHQILLVMVVRGQAQIVLQDPLMRAAAVAVTKAKQLAALAALAAVALAAMHLEQLLPEQPIQAAAAVAVVILLTPMALPVAPALSSSRFQTPSALNSPVA